MPLFDLKNAKKKLTSPSLSSLGLRKTQSTGNIDDACYLIVATPVKETKSILKTSSRKPPTPPPYLPSVPEDENDLLASKLKDITACDMELLLSLETQARMDLQEERNMPLPRPSKIKFELPVTPPRSRSPDKKHRWSLPDESLLRSEITASSKKKKLNRLTRWSRANSLNDSDEVSMTVGTKVKLIKRPLPTIGIIKYIGPVTIYGVTSEWVGVELESRVGDTNGSIEGYQYFLTDPQRGIFVKKEDLVII